MSNTLNSLMESVFDQYRDNVFLKFIPGKKTISYGQFRASVIKTAGYFTERLEAGSRIALDMDNTPEALAAFYAAVASGVVPVILNPSTPSEDIPKIAARTNATALVTTDGKRFAEFNDKKQASIKHDELLALMTMKVGAKDMRRPFPDEPRTSNGLAYITFSSGSTDKPKGVLISRKNMLFSWKAMADGYHFPNEINHLCLLPVCHASGLYRGILVPFLGGSTVHLQKQFELETFWDTIIDRNIGFVQVVPTIISTLLSAGNAPDKGKLRNLSFIGSASAPHSLEMIKKFEKRFGVKIAQGYGLTETTTGVFLNHPEERDDSHINTPGKPFNGINVEIVDKKGNSLPTGKTGEVVISGKCVAAGYLDDIQSEAKRLEGERLFTEDIGYLDDDGYLFIVGRNSELIHRGGFKIAPLEVEEAIISLPGVDNAVAFGIPHDLLGEDLIAYVACATGAKFDEDKIRASLLGKLPRYKIPTRFYPIDKTFESDNFKISRGYYKRKHLKSIAKACEELPPTQRIRQFSQTEAPSRAFKFNETVYLRPITQADIESKRYLDNMMDQEVQFYTAQGRFPQSQQTLRKYWEEVNNHEHAIFAICDTKNDEHVGNIALHIDWIQRTAEFGRLIFKEFQPRTEYSTEAMKLVMEYAFEELLLHKIWGEGPNPRSLPSLLRLGFTLEGKHRKHLLFKGEWKDMFFVGMLRDEYFEMRDSEAPKTNLTFDDLGVSAKIADELTSLVAKAFNAPKEELTPYSSPKEIPEWDSLGIVLLWSLMEEKFGISINSSDIITVTNLFDLATMIQDKKGNAPA